MPDSPNPIAEKAFLPQVQDRSVIDFPSGDQDMGARNLIWFAAQMGSLMPTWGTNVLRRDQMLREFVPTESVLSGAIGTVVARNAAMEWDLKGPPRITARCHELMHNANFGAGWLDFTGKLSWDLYTQDKGAFVEIIKEDPKDPESPTIGIANLDSQRCWHTGSPEKPVWYYDRTGKIIPLPWWRVWTLSEMPMPHESLYGLQLCAVSRIIEQSQIQVGYNTYMNEKANGRHNRALHVIQGVSQGEVKAAFATAQAAADQRGQARYIQPAVVAAMSPEARVSATTIDLAGLPDGFNALQEFQRYVAIIAMGLLTDYIELAPLPGGNLGTATQAETMERKSHAKGAQVFRKIVTHMMNFAGVLPKSVEFSYSIADPEADKRDEALALQRAQRRSVMIANGEIDAAVARQIAVDAGDIPQEIFDKMFEVDDVTGIAQLVEHSDDMRIQDEDQNEKQQPTATKSRVVRKIIRDASGNAVAAVEYK